MARVIAPLNTITRRVILKEMNDDGVLVPTTTGTWTGFLATTEEADETAADATLSASLTYEGGANGLAEGTWQWKLLGSAFTKALYTTHFATQGYAYIIVHNTPESRREVELVDVRESLRADLE